MAAKKKAKPSKKKKRKQYHELTTMQNAAAEAFIENGGNKSEAYRSCYSTSNMLPETVWSKACILFKLGKVASRVLELQESHRERHNVTIESLTKELDEAREMAKTETMPAVMTTATMGKAKLHGLVTDKKELSGPDGSAIPVQVTFIGVGK